MIQLPERWLQVELITSWIRRALHNSGSSNDEDVASLMKDIFVSRDYEYRLVEAIEWGENFEFPQDICTRDSNRLINSSTLLQMTMSLRQIRGHNRLNSSRVAFCVPADYPDYSVLMDLTEGIRVFTLDSFVPNSATGLPPLRKAYNDAHSAVNKMLYDLWEAELVFLLPKTQLLNLGNVHFSCQHWATKSMKKCGRPIHDASDPKHGAINCKEVSAMSESFYGPVVLPTVFDLAMLILQFEDSKRSELGDQFSLDDVILFKNDLSRAFMLLDFRPCDVRLLAAELTDDVCVVYHTGLFGLGTLPYAFAVISRVLERYLNVSPTGHPQMFGSLRVYVDDLMAVTVKQRLNADNRIVNNYCDQLLGPGAVEPKKFEAGRRLDFIGWCFDLDTRLVTISQKNFYKVAYAFFDVDLDRKVQVRMLEKLASLGSRYSMIIREMRVVNTAIYRNYANMNNHNAYIQWHDEAKVAVWLWRALLLELRLNESTFAKPIESFRSLLPSVVLCFDSSLSGVGVIIRSYVGVDDIGLIREGPVIALGSFQYSCLPDPIVFNDESSYQNLSEFIGIVYGLLILSTLKIRHTGVFLKGDSVTAMRWSDGERFRGVLSKPAALTYLKICVEYGYEVVGTEYVTSEENSLCDSLSRGTSPVDLCQKGLCDTSLIYKMRDSVASAISLCNYAYTFTTIDDLLCFWRRVKECLEP